MDEDTNAFKIVTGIPTEKKPLGKPRSKWEDNIKMDLREIGVLTTISTDSAQDTLIGEPL